MPTFLLQVGLSNLKGLQGLLLLPTNMLLPIWTTIGSHAAEEQASKTHLPPYDFPLLMHCLHSRITYATNADHTRSGGAWTTVNGQTPTGSVLQDVSNRTKEKSAGEGKRQAGRSPSVYVCSL